MKLSEGRRGFRGVVVSVGRNGAVAGSDCAGTLLEAGPVAADAKARESELERRLLEIGFVEGARVEILHEGFIGRDPIAVRVDSMRVALRKREAEAILVQAAPAASGNR